MRNSRLLWVLVVVLSLVAFVHASTPPTQVLAIRQDKEDDAKETPVKDEEDPKTTPKDDEEEDPTITPKPSQTSKDDEEESDSSKAASGTKTTRTTRIPFNSPAGRIDMKDPSIFDPMRFYPLSQGDPITWVYNMTGVLASPTAINIEAFCPSQQRYYTIASNYSAAETEVVWDVEEYQSTSALLAETYMLYMYDSANSRTDIPKPGHLGTYNNLRFGLYTPRAPTPISEYKCTRCSAGAILASHEVRVLLGTSIIVALSFSWFLAGVGRLL